jgi:hypothetical protein
LNGAFRAGLGADFPFLSDEDRAVAEELDILELTDEKHRPYLPLTFILDSRLVIRRSWSGFWFWGNPTPDEIRMTLREITREEQPSYDAVAVWASGGAAPADAGIDAPVVWIRRGLAGQRALARRLALGGDPNGRRRTCALHGRRALVDGGRDRAHRRPHCDPPAQEGRPVARSLSRPSPHDGAALARAHLGWPAVDVFNPVEALARLFAGLGVVSVLMLRLGAQSGLIEWRRKRTCLACARWIAGWTLQAMRGSAVRPTELRRPR